MTEQHGQLGVQVEYPRHYDPSVLHPIDRKQGRQGLGDGTFSGHDTWNLWELSWLREDGVPVVATGQLRVPADSPFMVESKSLKLYLNSLNQSRFADADGFKQCVEADLSACIAAPVDLELCLSGAGSDAELLPIEQGFAGKSIDQGKLVAHDFDAALSRLIHRDSSELEQHWVSEAFRSLCPVTGQPDWARIDIRVLGAEINPDALLSYLVAYRNHGGFHEQCVEKIWADLQRQGGFAELEVLARFTRRGGIDICPYRSSRSNGGRLKGLSRARAFRQ